VPPAAFLQCVLQYSSPEDAGHLHGVWAHFFVDSALFISPSYGVTRSKNDFGLRQSLEQSTSITTVASCARSWQGFSSKSPKSYLETVSTVRGSGWVAVPKCEIAIDYEYDRFTHPLPRTVLTVSKRDALTLRQSLMAITSHYSPPLRVGEFHRSRISKCLTSRSRWIHGRSV